MARPSRIPSALLLAALLAPVPLAAGSKPGKPVAATRPAKPTPALTPVQMLTFLAMVLAPKAGAALEPAPAAGTGLAPAAGPDLPSLARYMDVCPTYVPESFFDGPSHCSADPTPVQDLDGEGAAGVAGNMGMTWLVEELALSATRRALDLADCVCRAYRAYDRVGTMPQAQRDQLLYDRLLATRTQRNALGSAISDFKQVIYKDWDVLAKDNSLWAVPDAGDLDAVGPEVPWPERVVHLKEMIATLEAAKDQWDAAVGPRTDRLKRQLRQIAKARAAKEAYDTTVIPALQDLKGKVKTGKQ